jgi:hypothetical protein
VPTLIEQLEYAACGQGPDAEQTLYWRARCEILQMQKRLDRWEPKISVSSALSISAQQFSK